MARVDLEVPFAEKEEAKRLGARWDARQRVWYVPDGLDGAAFERWLPELRGTCIRAPEWYLIGASRKCWRCGVASRVFAIVLPPGYEALDGEEDRWERGEDAVLLSYVNDVPVSVAAQLHRLAPRYRVEYSRTIHSLYWMNHCEHCEEKLGDFETIEEPGTFFQLGVGPNQRRLIVEELHTIVEPFSGRCGGLADVE